MTTPRSSLRGPASGKTWLIRGAVAVVAGLTIGAASGAVGVQRVEPGRPGQTDSIQLLLDSLQRRRTTESPREKRRAVDSADAEHRAQRVDDSVALANDPDAPVIPDVVNLEEGDARNAIENAGLTVGSVQFRASTNPAGVVLATTPAAGRKVPAGSVVNLVLSDGRAPPSDSADSLSILTVPPRTP